MEKISVARLGMHLLEVEITTRCNLNCLHCYNRNDKKIDLPKEKFFELYNFAIKQNLWTFIMSGGEAILHSEFDQIKQFVKGKRRQFRLVIQTNGGLINSSNIEIFRNFDLVHISYDLVDDLRVNASKNLDLASKLKKSGISCYLFVTIHKNNLNLIDTMVENSQIIGVPIGFNLCLPVEKVGENLLLTRQETAQVEEKLYKLYLQKRILRYSSPLTSILKYKENPPKSKHIRGGCTAGIAACVVSPLGDVFPCPFFRIVAGNIFQQDLSEIWLNSNLFSRLRNRSEFKEPCQRCEFLFYCGGCRNRAYKYSGDLQGSDPICYK